MECDVDFCCRIIVFGSIDNERVTRRWIYSQSKLQK